MTDSPFLETARQGRGSGWIYLLGIGFILGSWLVIGSILTVVVLLAFGGFEAMNSLDNLSAEGLFIATNASFLPFLLATVLFVWLAHGRSPKTLVTPIERIDWRRMGLAFVLWMLLAGLVSLVEFLVWPETFHINYEPQRYLAFIALPLLLTPMQILSEELFFRGYLLQALGLLTRNRVMLVLLSGILFLLPHLANPELYLGEDAISNFILTALFYFLFGGLTAWATLKDNSMEIAIGAHAANNLYVGLFVNFEGSALATPALVMTSHYNAGFNLLAFVVGVLLFAALMFKVFKKNPSPENQ
jgi:membrane protease YdiL (CAAX protease family)